MGVLTFAQARKYVPKPPSKVHDHYDNGDTQDIIETMLYADKQEAKNRYMKQLAPFLRGRDAYETCQNVYNFFRKGFRYVADPRGWEQVKSSRWAIYYGNTQGLDCKSYSIAIVAILRELGIKCVYRFVSWDANRDVSHVYPIALLKDGAYQYPVAVDAIPDSCGFDCEIRYAYKKDYDMTKISYIDGVNAANEPSAHEVPTARNINYTSLTLGEAHVAIIRDRLNLLASVHPDNPNAKAWLKGIDWADNVLYRGLHSGNAALPFGLFRSAEEQHILAAIKKAQKLRTPAQGDMIALIDRSNSIQGIRELGHVGEIPLEDCFNLCTTYEKAYDEYGYEYDKAVTDEGCRLACEERNLLTKEVNKIGREIPHHFLYEYLTAPQAEMFKLNKLAKQVEQQAAVTTLSSVSKVSRSLIREYFKTEAMRKHAANPIIAAAMTPEEAISELMKYPDRTLYQMQQDGEIQGLPILIQIAILVFAAATGAVAVIQALQGREPTALDRFVTLSKVMFNTDKSASYAAEPADFKDTRNQPCGTGFTKDTATGQCVPIPSTPSGSNDWLLPAAAAGAVVVGLTMTGKKKKKK